MFKINLILFKLFSLFFVNSYIYAQHEGTNKYLPLILGNKWTFIDHSNDLTRTWEVVDTQTISNELYFRITEKNDYPNLWYRSTEDEIFVRDKDCIDTVEHLMFNFSTQLNSSWWNDLDCCYYGYITTLISKTANVVTEQVDYKSCFHFELKACFDYGISNVWFAKDIGIVKYIKDEFQILEFELESSILTSIATQYKITEIKDDISLEQNYPNPFNSSTRINFILNRDDYVRLEIFNTVGEKVKTLIENEMNAGSYEAYFNAKYLSNGIYYYQLVHGNKSIIKKMLYLK